MGELVVRGRAVDSHLSGELLGFLLSAPGFKYPAVAFFCAFARGALPQRRTLLTVIPAKAGTQADGVWALPSFTPASVQL